MKLAMLVAGLALAGTVLVGCSDDDTSADDGATARTDAGGVTFTYPTDHVSGVDAVVDTDGAAPQVRFDLDGEGFDDAALVVTVVRDRSGVELVGLADDRRAALEDLESALPSAEEATAFVNGEGLRTVSEGTPGGYRFVGTTDDGLLLVELDAVLDTSSEELVAALDEIVGSVFVDGVTLSAGVPTCEDDLELVADVTIPEGTVVEPGVELDKTWRIRNTGSCTWGPGWSWAFGGGDPLAIVSTSPIGTVEPGGETDVTVTFRAPEEPGIHAGQWQLLGPGTPDPVGPPAVVVIEVAPG